MKKNLSLHERSNDPAASVLLDAAQQDALLAFAFCVVAFVLRGTPPETITAGIIFAPTISPDGNLLAGFHARTMSDLRTLVTMRVVAAVSVTSKRSIGHARSAMVFDVIRRYLLHKAQDTYRIAVLGGAVDTLRAAGHRVGIYTDRGSSPANDWRDIMGDYRLLQTQNWVFRAGDSETGGQMCAKDISFSGGPVVMVQLPTTVLFTRNSTVSVPCVPRRSVTSTPPSCRRCQTARSRPSPRSRWPASS